MGADGGTSDGPTQAEGIADLVFAWDRLAAGRRRGHPRIPAFLCVGGGASDLVTGYADRLVDDEGAPAVPHVLVDAPANGAALEDGKFFDNVANGLATRMPPGTGELRLSLYWRLRDTLDVQVTKRGRKAMRRELVRKLYDEFAEDNWIARALADLGTDDDGHWRNAQLALSPFVVGLPRWLFRTHLVRSRRFRSFTDEMKREMGTGHKDFLDAALMLIERSRIPGNEDVVRRVLMSGLLDGLEAAVRPSRLSVRRRRRTTPFVVLLPEAGAGTPARRFLDTFVEVEGERARGVTLVVASAGEGAEAAGPAGPAATGPAGPAGTGPAGTEPTGPAAGPEAEAGTGTDADRPVDPSVAAALAGDQVAPPSGEGAGRRARHRPTPRSLLVVRVPGGPVGSDDQARLVLEPRVVPSSDNHPVAVPAVLLGLLVVAAVLVAGVAVRVAGGGGDCSGIRRRAGSTELTGLSDGTAACSFVVPDGGGPGEADGPVEQAVREVELEIAAANRDVIAQADGQYEAVVYMAPLTLPEGEAESSGYTSLRELRGVALAQRTANGLARDDRNQRPLVVLLASPGDKFAHGPAVAEQIVERAEGDGPDGEVIVGVVGISQSREASREAIGILQRASLPVIGGTLTGDEMVGSSDFYYQVAPNNDRAARVMVEFALRYPLVGAGGDGRPGTGARNAVIVTDHSDEYSDDLADDIHQHFTRPGHRVVRSYSYAAEDEDQPLPQRPGQDVVPVESFERLADNLCREIDPAQDVVFYTSRPQQFPGLVNALDGEPGCEGRRIALVGGDTVSRLMQGPGVDLARYEHFLDLYYVAFGAPDLPESGSETDRFVAAYSEDYDEADIASDISEPALNYDAVLMVQRAVNQVSQGGSAPEADLVASELRNGEVAFDGATGHIDVNGDLDTSRVPRDKPVLVVEAGEAVPRLVCGRFTEAPDGNVTRWGALGALPCPRDERPAA
jgi:hypothetical protein